MLNEIKMFDTFALSIFHRKKKIHIVIEIFPKREREIEGKKENSRHEYIHRIEYLFITRSSFLFAFKLRNNNRIYNVSTVTSR